MLERQSKERYLCLLSLKKYALVFSAILSHRFGTQEHTHRWSPWPLGFSTSLRDWNLCSHGSMMELHRTSGSLDSSSPSHSSRVPSRTLPESTSLLSISSTTISRSFQMRPRPTLTSHLRMVFTSSACSWRDADGTKEKRLLKNPYKRFCTLQWRVSTLSQPRSQKLTTVILTAAQFTSRRGELEPCPPLVIQPTSFWMFTCQCRNSTKTSIGSREEWQCLQCCQTERNKFNQWNAPLVCT